MQAAAPNIYLNQLTRVEISPHDTSRVVVARSSAGTGGLFFSEDGGATFRYLDLGGGSHSTEVNLVPSRKTPGRLYVIAFFNGSLVVQRFFVFDDWGERLDTFYNTPIEARHEPNFFHIDENDVLFTREFISKDGGETWLKTPEDGRYSVFAVAQQGQQLYSLRRRDETFRNYDHYVSYDTGQTWTPLNVNEPLKSGATAIDMRDSTLFSVNRNGAFAYTRSGIVGTTAEEGEPDISSLRLRAYPNPFRATVAIETEAPVDNTITVEIFDVLGRRVATLAGGVRGTTRFSWDGRSSWGETLGAGVYLVRVRSTGPHTRTQTVVLTRID